MPNLRKGESKNDYTSRCISELMKEGYDVSQASAICYSKYKVQKSASYLKKK